MKRMSVETMPYWPKQEKMYQFGETDLVRKYFKGATSHGSRRPLEPGGLFVFTSVCGFDFGEHLGNLEFVVDPDMLSEGGWRDESTFYLDGEPLRYYSLFSDKKLRGGTRGRLLGHFFPDIGSLVTCDLTHTIKGTALLKTIIKELIELGLLKEYTEPKEKPRKKVKKPLPVITLGADPEFEVIRRGSVIFAGDVLVDPEIDEPFGLDGSRETAEARPDPGHTPEEVISNIEDILDSVLGELQSKNLSLGVKGDCFPTGCHIHIGGVRFNRDLDFPLLKLFDKALYAPCKKLNGAARGGYAGAGNYETKDWGFEYRSLPGAIMSNKRLFFLVAKAMQNLSAKWWGEVEVPSPNCYPKTILKAGGLTEHEINDFFQLIDSDLFERSVLENWGLADDESYKKKPMIVFSDRWHPPIKELFRERIASANPKEDIHLYGLAAERGMVLSGLHVSEIETIPHQISPQTIAFGIPKAIRIGLCPGTRERILKGIERFLETTIGGE